MTVERWLNTEEMAEHVGVHAETIRRWARERRYFPVTKLGREWRGRASDIDLWITKEFKPTSLQSPMEQYGHQLRRTRVAMQKMDRQITKGKLSWGF